MKNPWNLECPRIQHFDKSTSLNDGPRQIPGWKISHHFKPPCSPEILSCLDYSNFSVPIPSNMNYDIMTDRRWKRQMLNNLLRCVRHCCRTGKMVGSYFVRILYWSHRGIFNHDRGWSAIGSIQIRCCYTVTFNRDQARSGSRRSRSLHHSLTDVCAKLDTD